MSYSRKVSYNNSTFNKADKKALSAIDADEKFDGGAAIAVAMDRCVSRQFKEIHRAPTDAMRIPDKAILKVDESKLAVKRSEDDFGFAVKPSATKVCPNAPKKAPKKQNLAAELFAHATSSATGF